MKQKKWGGTKREKLKKCALTWKVVSTISTQERREESACGGDSEGKKPASCTLKGRKSGGGGGEGRGGESGVNGRGGRSSIHATATGGQVFELSGLRRIHGGRTKTNANQGVSHVLQTNWGGKAGLRENDNCSRKRKLFGGGRGGAAASAKWVG